MKLNTSTWFLFEDPAFVVAVVEEEGGAGCRQHRNEAVEAAEAKRHEYGRQHSGTRARLLDRNDGRFRSYRRSPVE
ncbi:MAG: hypothetical protein J0651_00340, partial [Actinobacteria bacterium]|nr:hypothetical protein [Actinomycetota bacterium]